MTTKKTKPPKTAVKKNATVKNSVLKVKKTVTNNIIALNAKKNLGHFVDEETAYDMIAAVAEQDRRTTLDYNKDIIQQLLNQDSVVGIRIYDAINSNGEKTYVIMGYDSNGFNILINSSDGTKGAIDMGQPCTMEPSAYQQ